MVCDVSSDIVRAGSSTFPFKGARLAGVDRVALITALLVAAAAAYGWILGIIVLSGIPHVRFDNVMVAWFAEIELALALPVWLLLRAIRIGMRMKTGRRV